jgi:hypothetical protein
MILRLRVDDREQGQAAGTGSRDRQQGQAAGTGSRDREQGTGTGNSQQDREQGFTFSRWSFYPPAILIG